MELAALESNEHDQLLEAFEDSCHGATLCAFPLFSFSS